MGSGGAAMAVPEPCSMKAPAPMTAATGSARERSRKEPRDLCPLMCLADGAEFFVVFLMASASQRHLAVRPRRRNSITLSKRTALVSGGVPAVRCNPVQVFWKSQPSSATIGLQQMCCSPQPQLARLREQ